MLERGIPHIVIDLGGKNWRPTGSVPALSRLCDYVRILTRFALAAATRPGTVYLTVAQSAPGFLRDCVMIWLARLFGHRVVIHLHGGNYDGFYAAQPRWLRALIRVTLRRTARILVLGERLRKMFDFDPRLRSRVHVVPNGLPVEYVPSSASKKLPTRAEGGPIRVLFLSNLIESKGYLELLTALYELHERFGIRNVECDFCGTFLVSPGEDEQVTSAEQARALFEQRVDELGLMEQVTLRGSVAGEEKERVLRRAHFFVLSTRYRNEGQPVSIIEAMAHGNVVISTDFRAIPDMVRDGVTGRLVPVGDPSAIAEAIHELVREPSRYEEMSRAAREHFRRNFTRQAHLDRLLGFLTGPVEPASGAAPAAAGAAPPGHASVRGV